MDLVELIRLLDEQAARLFAVDCAEHVLPIYESAWPDDDRPRRAVQAARRYYGGEIDREEMHIAMRAVPRIEHPGQRAGGAYYPADAAADAVRWCDWRCAHTAAINATRVAQYAGGPAERRWQADRLARLMPYAEHPDYDESWRP